MGYSTRDCNRIAAYLGWGAGASSIIALFSTGTVIGIPAGVFYGAAAILSIGAGTFSAGAGGSGVDASYDWNGKVFWFNILW